MLDIDHNALIASTSEKDIHLVPGMANRHGLITGATGTGKTVTLQTMAETFSDMGVSVFLADAKGDLSGLAKAGTPKGKVAERIASLALAQKGYAPQGNPVCFWDVFGRAGHPLRTTISEMGPLLLSRLLNLNEVQSGLLHIVFRIADDAGLLLLDMKDLRSMIQHVGDNRDTYSSSYGQVSSASVGAILRALLRLESEGGDVFFGEPALDVMDMMQTDSSGKGVINVLASDALLNSPRLYACLLLWLLSEFFERLPEVGDSDKPKLVFFFDEAHLLFDGAPQALLQKIEQVARLIRSRGVGIYFVSQSPADIPDSVLGQLGNRVQHALRAFTPKEQKAVRVAAQAFRPNPLFATEEVIGTLAVGEALVSFLDSDGSPRMVERAYIVPPQSQVGPIEEDERKAVMKDSLVAGVYDIPIDRESAYEVLTARMQSSSSNSKSGTREDAARQKQEEREKRLRMKEEEHQQKMRIREENQAAKIRRQQELQEKRAAKDAASKDIFGMLVKQTGRTITSTVGREIGKSLLRGVLGTLFGKR